MGSEKEISKKSPIWTEEYFYKFRCPEFTFKQCILRVYKEFWQCKKPTDKDLQYLIVFLNQSSFFKHKVARSVLSELLVMKNEKLAERYYKGLKSFISKLVDTAIAKDGKKGRKKLKFSSDIISRTRHLSLETLQKQDLKQSLLIKEADFLEGFPRAKKLIKKVLKHKSKRNNKSKRSHLVKDRGEKKKKIRKQRKNEKAQSEIDRLNSSDISGDDKMNTSTLRASPSNVTSAEYASSSELITDSTFDQSSTLTSSLPSLTDDDSLAASANHSDSQSDVINEKTDSLGSANSPDNEQVSSDPEENPYAYLKHLSADVDYYATGHDDFNSSPTSDKRGKEWSKVNTADFEREASNWYYQTKYQSSQSRSTLSMLKSVFVMTTKRNCLWSQLLDAEVKRKKKKQFTTGFIFIQCPRSRKTVAHYLRASLRSLSKAECRLFSYLFELKGHIESIGSIGQGHTPHSSDVRASVPLHNNASSLLLGGDVAVWACEVLDEWTVLLDSTHNSLHIECAKLNERLTPLWSICEQVVDLLSTHKSNTLKVYAKLRHFSLSSPGLIFNNYWSLLAVRFVEALVTDYNNIGFLEQTVFRSDQHSELPYPPGVAALIKQRLRKKLSIIDEDFVILNHVKNTVALLQAGIGGEAS